MMTEPMTPPTHVELMNQLAGQRMALGRALKAVGERIVAGQDPIEASNTVESVRKRIAGLEAALEVTKQRASDDQAMQAYLSKQAQAEREREVLAHLAGIGAKVQQWLNEGSLLIGTELMPAFNAARAVADDATRQTLTNAIIRFIPCLHQVAFGMPGATVPLTSRDKPWIEFLPKPTEAP